MAFLSTTSDGDNTASRFELSDRETTIGRHPECSIVVDAGAVSRYHAKVSRRPNGYFIEDSGSRNGTFLNGQLLTGPQFLREGDRIRVSDVEFVFRNSEVPGFVGNEMTFDGANFGIMMYDEQETEQLSNLGGGSSSGTAKVEFRSSVDGFQMTATPEAKLEALKQIISNLGEALAVDEVLPKILSSLFDLFPAADRGFIVMQGEDGSLVPRWVKTRAQHDETETVRISRTIVREVIKNKQAILSMDAANDSRFDSSQSIADFSIRSMICAPLMDADNKAFGVLQIDSTQGRGQFREEDTDLLAGVASYAGILINNARLHERALRQKEVEQDLKLATDVQQAFLPNEPPKAPGFHMSSFYQAANHIGGDYYDYVQLADGRVAIVVADVVGHGVAAAMFMAKLSAEARFSLASEPDVALAIERLNDRMSELHVDRFITLLVLVIDPRSEAVTIVNAGHMSPVVRSARDGAISEPGEQESGLPIAIDSGMDYEAVKFDMDAGDLAVLFTDGINEAMDADDEEFGIDRIRELTALGGNADQVRDRIVDAVREHCGNCPPFDDMCLVVIERLSDAASTRKLLTDTVDDNTMKTEIS
jgi:serine phosphatase RsbU (regulator of sigma subunit)